MRFLLRIPLAVVLLFLGAAALTVYLLTQTSLPYYAIDRALSHYIESRYNVKIEFGKLGGAPLRHLVIEDIRVDAEVDSVSFRLLKIERIELHYDLRRIWRGDWNLDTLTIETPTAFLRRTADKRFLLPQLGSGDASAESRELPDIKVGNFRLENGRCELIQDRGNLVIDSVFLACQAQHRDGIFQVQLDTLSLRYPQRSFRLQQLRAGLAISKSGLGVDSLYLATDLTQLIGGGLYSFTDTIPAHVVISNSTVSLTELAGLLGAAVYGEFLVDASVLGFVDNFSGQLSASGTLFDREMGPLETDIHFVDGILKFENLRGRGFGGTLAGRCEIDFVARPETFHGTLDVRNINLEKIIPETFATNLSGRLEINGSGFGENSFNVDLLADFGPGVFDFVRFDSLRGALSLNVDDLYLHPDFALYYKNSIFTAEGFVDYTGEMMLDGTFTTSQLADFWGDLFIEELSGGASAEFHVDGPVLDPNLRGTFRGDSCSFYGFSTDSLEAHFDIASFLISQRGSVQLRAWRSSVWNLPADSVYAAIDLDSNIVLMKRITQFHDRFLLEGSGTAELIDDIAKVTVADFALEFDSLRYVNTTPIRVDFLTDRIVVYEHELRGNEGTLNLRCDYGYDTTIVLQAKSDAFHFTPWLKVLELDTLLTGTLKVDALVTGKLANPTIVVQGGIRDLVYDRDSLGTFETVFRYEDSVVTFADLGLSYRGYDVKISGEFPLVVDLDSGLVTIPEHPMNLHLESQGNDLSILSSLNEDLESLTGDFVLELDVYGTPRQPRSRGYFNLENGTAKVYQIRNPIEDIEARISSNDNQVIVEWVQAKIRHKRHKPKKGDHRSGTVRAAGEIMVLSQDVFDYRLTAVGFGVPLQYDLGEIYAHCDFDLAIDGSSPPVVTGDVAVYEADYTDEFPTEAEALAIEAADTTGLWDYNLNVELLPASVRVRNSDVNMVVDGQVRVIRENARDNYLGTVNIVRGTFYLFDLNFRVEPGSYLQFASAERPDPELHVRVTTRVRTLSGDVTSGGYDELELMIGGTLLQPRVAAAEGSRYSDADIVTLLLWNQASTGADGIGGSDFQERLRQGFTGYLASITGQELARKLGVEVIEITPVYGQKNNIEDVAISLGFYTLPNVYTYVSSLTTEGRGDYGVEYRLGRNFLFGGRYDRNNLWRLDLNLNWEFR